MWALHTRVYGYIAHSILWLTLEQTKHIFFLSFLLTTIADWFKGYKSYRICVFARVYLCVDEDIIGEEDIQSVSQCTHISLTRAIGSYIEANPANPINQIKSRIHRKATEEKSVQSE